MSRPSSVDKLDPEIQALIERLRSKGWSIDQIREHLIELYSRAPSRSALGRHVQGMDATMEDIRKARIYAMVASEDLSDVADSQLARVNIELTQASYMRSMIRERQDEIASGEEGKLTADDFMKKSKGQESLARASKINIDIILAAEKRGAEKTMAVVEKVAKSSGGISAETLAAIRAGVFGVAA